MDGSQVNEPVVGSASLGSQTNAMSAFGDRSYDCPESLIVFMSAIQQRLARVQFQLADSRLETYDATQIRFEFFDPLLLPYDRPVLATKRQKQFIDVELDLRSRFRIGEGLCKTAVGMIFQRRHV